MTTKLAVASDAMSNIRMVVFLKQKGATAIPAKAATVSTMRKVPVDTGLHGPRLADPFFG